MKYSSLKKRRREERGEGEGGKRREGQRGGRQGGREAYKMELVKCSLLQLGGGPLGRVTPFHPVPGGGTGFLPLLIWW